MEEALNNQAKQSAACAFACWVCYVALLLLGLTVAANGQGPCPGGVCPTPYRPLQQGRPFLDCERQPYDVQIEAPDASSPGGAFSGSGTSIARKDGGTVVVTNHHVIKDARQYFVVTGGNRYPARLLASDSQADVALLWVAVPLPYVNLATEVPRGAVAQFRAFDGGVQFRAWSGRIIGFKYDSYIADTYSLSGNSGGGVYVNNQLVGVLWGNRGVGPGGQMRLAFTGVGPVRRLLARVGIGIAAAYPPTLPATDDPGPASGPTPAAPQPPANTTPPEDCGCREKFAAINKMHAELLERTEALESNAGKVSQLLVDLDQNLDARIDARVASQVAEIKFPPPPDTAAIENRLTQLEQRLGQIEGKTFRVYTHTPAGVFDSERLNIGDDIHIQYVPVEE